MKKVIFIIGLCITLLPTTSDAQLKGLKKNLEKAKNSITGKSGATKTVELDFESKSRMPAVAWYSLLDAVRLSLDGKLTMAADLDVYFLPNKTVSGQTVNFRSNYMHEIVLWADVVDAATQEKKGTIHFIAYDHNVGHPKSTIEQKTGTSQDEFTDFVQLKDGKYELQFFAGDTHYYTFPFEVIKKTSANAYSAMSEMYFLEGSNLWKDYAYIKMTYDEAHNQNVLNFSYYVGNEDTNVKDASRPDETLPAEYNAIVKRGNQLIGTHYWGANGKAQYQPSLQLHGDSQRGRWLKNSRDLSVYPRRNSSDRPQQVSLEADLKDGSYTIEVSIKLKDQPLEKRIFPFTVKGGRIQSLAETKSKDSKRVLEQGPEIIFLKRTK
ncbi:MAG: hypothetical protein AAGG68_23045 [Bacteroidota bacterium]